jgi:hypothetical protein
VEESRVNAAIDLVARGGVGLHVRKEQAALRGRRKLTAGRQEAVRPEAGWALPLGIGVEVLREVVVGLLTSLRRIRLGCRRSRRTLGAPTADSEQRDDR